MRFGRTIVGGVVATTIGVLLHIAFEVFARVEAPWFAIIIGLLTGLCVRKFDSSSAGYVSYVRGAVAGLITLSGIFTSTYLLGIIMTRQAASAKGRPAIVGAMRSVDGVVSGRAEVRPIETELNAPVDATRSPISVAATGADRRDNFSVLQFSFIAVGAFIAYELGRGSSLGRTSQEKLLRESSQQHSPTSRTTTRPMLAIVQPFFCKWVHG